MNSIIYMDDIEFRVWAWGRALGEDGKLYEYDSECNTCMARCVVPANLILAVADEIAGVALDQYADWPTVDRLLALYSPLR
jgi:hypothetical protein